MQVSAKLPDWANDNARALAQELVTGGMNLVPHHLLRPPTCFACGGAWGPEEGDGADASTQACRQCGMRHPASADAAAPSIGLVLGLGIAALRDAVRGQGDVQLTVEGRVFTFPHQPGTLLQRVRGALAVAGDTGLTSRELREALRLGSEVPNTRFREFQRSAQIVDRGDKRNGGVIWALSDPNRDEPAVSR